MLVSRRLWRRRCGISFWFRFWSVGDGAYSIFVSCRSGCGCRGRARRWRGVLRDRIGSRGQFLIYSLVLALRRRYVWWRARLSVVPLVMARGRALMELFWRWLAAAFGMLSFRSFWFSNRAGIVGWLWWGLWGWGRACRGLRFWCSGVEHCQALFCRDYVAKHQEWWRHCDGRSPGKQLHVSFSAHKCLRNNNHQFLLQTSRYVLSFCVALIIQVQLTIGLTRHFHHIASVCRQPRPCHRRVGCKASSTMLNWVSPTWQFQTQSVS